MKIKEEVKLALYFVLGLSAIILLGYALMPTTVYADTCLSKDDTATVIQQLQSGQICADMLTDYQASVDNLMSQLGLADKEIEAQKAANAELKKGMGEMETKCTEAVKAARPSLWDKLRWFGAGFVTGVAASVATFIGL